MNVNQVFLAGRLTRDPEMRTSASGTTVVKFSIAINEYAGADKEDRVTFVDVVAFGKRGEAIANYLEKGSPIFIHGKLSYSKWEAQDGNKRSKLEVIVDDFQFVGGPRGNEEPSSSKRHRHRKVDMDVGGPDVDSDDIPF